MLSKSLDVFWSTPGPPTKQKRVKKKGYSAPEKMTTFAQHLRLFFLFRRGSGGVEKCSGLLLNIGINIIPIVHIVSHQTTIIVY